MFSDAKKTSDKTIIFLPKKRTSFLAAKTSAKKCIPSKSREFLSLGN